MCPHYAYLLSYHTLMFKFKIIRLLFLSSTVVYMPILNPTLKTYNSD